MMKFLGIKHFRLSISWPRVMPDGTIGSKNQKGIDFYNNVINALVAADITPWVTLYHWDLPSALMDKTPNGGWLNRSIIDKFNDFADLCFSSFGDRVKNWVTFNEPISSCWLGYGVGVHAPGRCSKYMGQPCEEVGGGGDSTREPYLCSHIMILAHAKAVNTLRSKYSAQNG